MLLIVVVINATMKNLHVVNDKVYDLANTDGDLTKMLDVKSGDELELIANNINGLVSFIRGIITNISGNSVDLSDRSG